MKKLFVIISLIVLSQASYAKKSKPTLTCYSEENEKLTWSEPFGEIIVNDRNGNELLSIDGQDAGIPEYTETFPAKIITSIYYGEDPDTITAEIEEVEGHIYFRVFGSQEKLFLCVKPKIRKQKKVRQ